MRRERVMKFVIFSEAKAHSQFTAMMYGLKLVHFKTHSNGAWAEAVPFTAHSKVRTEVIRCKSLQRVRA